MCEANALSLTPQQAVEDRDLDQKSPTIKADYNTENRKLLLRSENLDLDQKDLTIKDEHNLENLKLCLSSENFFLEDFDLKDIQIKDEDYPF